MSALLLLNDIDELCGHPSTNFSIFNTDVAGLAALVLETSPFFSPSQVFETMKTRAIEGVVSDAGPGSPNLLVDTSRPPPSPSALPSVIPSFQPTETPSALPTVKPSSTESESPVVVGSSLPSVSPSRLPTESPSLSSSVPTLMQSSRPSVVSSRAPAVAISSFPSVSPSHLPTDSPTLSSAAPTLVQSSEPTSAPSHSTSSVPTVSTALPTFGPTVSGMTPWLSEEKLFGKNAGALYKFGYSVDMASGFLVVGGPRQEGAGSGRVYIHTQGVAPNQWAFQTRLKSPEASIGDNFGFALDLDGNTLVVSGRGEQVRNKEHIGSIYVYVGVGNGWNLIQTLTASDGDVGDFYGSSVAVSRNTVAVGAMRDDHSGGFRKGSVYVYTRQSEDGLFGSEQKIVAGDSNTTLDFTLFGRSVDIDENVLAVGTQDHSNGNRAGAVYVFEREQDQPFVERAKLLGSCSDCLFGWDIAVNNGIIAVSSVGADVVDLFSSTYPYVWEQTLTASDRLGETGYPAQFGSSISVGSGRIVIGAPYGDGDIIDSGAAYVFNYNETASRWQEQTKLKASDGGRLQRFGSGVAIDEEAISVGARTDDQDGFFSGATYSYSPALSPL